jgi:hypothetical protein
LISRLAGLPTNILSALSRDDGELIPALVRDSPVQSPLQKDFRSRFTQITSISPAVSFLFKGRIAIVTDAERDVVDVSGATDERAGSRTAKSCGPDAPTLASSLRSYPHATVARKHGHRGEHEGNR